LRASATDEAGEVNTGGGAGAGGGVLTPSSHPGGSGIVILKYPDTLTIAVGAGLTATTDPPSSGYKVTTFTAGTDTISFS
jgi:hypothetical protein